MPQSLANLTIHVVFATKHRAPVLGPDLHDDLHAYIAGTLRNLGRPSIRVGGVEDHVHLLFALSRTATLADVVSQIKTSSSHWLKTKGLREFAWQSGYGAFAVGPTELDRIVAYIQRQEEHHAKMSFEDEYRTLLKEAGIEFDERLRVGLRIVSPLQDSLFPAAHPGLTARALELSARWAYGVGCGCARVWPGSGFGRSWGYGAECRAPARAGYRVSTRWGSRVSTMVGLSLVAAAGLSVAARRPNGPRS